jgi:hypothetical protein
MAKQQTSMELAQQLDLKKDTPKDIAKKIIENVSPTKAAEIYRALGSFIKARDIEQAGQSRRGSR